MEEELSLDNILGAEEIENLFVEDVTWPGKLQKKRQLAVGPNLKKWQN